MVYTIIIYFAGVFIIIDISNTMNIFGYMTMIRINFQEIFIILQFNFWYFVHWEKRKKQKQRKTLLLKFAFLLLKYCKNWNLLFYCSNIAKSENAMLWCMLSRLETYSLLLYMTCNSRKINRPTKNMTKIVTLLHF